MEHEKRQWTGKHPVSWLIFVLSLSVEFVFATLPILLQFANPHQNWPWLVFVLTAIPRVILFVCIDIALNWKWWWKRYLRVDSLLVTAIASMISYTALVMAQPGDIVFRSIAVASYGPVLFCLVGHIRNMCKWFDFNGYTVFIYKLMRFYHVVIFILSETLPELLEVLGVIHEAEEEEPVEHKADNTKGLKAAFIAATLHLVLHLLHEVEHVQEHLSQHKHQHHENGHQHHHEEEDGHELQVQTLPHHHSNDESNKESHSQSHEHGKHHKNDSAFPDSHPPGPAHDQT